MITLIKLQEEVAKWSRKQYPRRRAHQPLLEAQSKLGELSKEFALLEAGEQGSPESHRHIMEDSVAHCIISLMDFCERNEIDASEAVLHTWSKLKMRNWSPDDGVSPELSNQ